MLVNFHNTGIIAQLLQFYVGYVLVTYDEVVVTSLVITVIDIEFGIILSSYTDVYSISSLSSDLFRLSVANNFYG